MEEESSILTLLNAAFELLDCSVLSTRWFWTLEMKKKKKKFSGPALFSTSPVSRRKRTVCHGIHLEEQEDLLVCNYIIMLILFATFSITRSPRYQAGFIGIISFHGVTYRI